MLQFPSNWAAIADGAEEMIAKAVDRATAQLRMPSIGVLVRLFAAINSSCPGGEAPPRVGGQFANAPHIDNDRTLLPQLWRKVAIPQGPKVSIKACHSL